MIVNNLLEIIGNTICIKVKNVIANDTSRIFLKLECLNPTLSLKDRLALALVNDAEKSGKLKKGSTIIESTSGNLGRSLSLICNQRGYRLILVLDPKVSQTNLSYYKAFGAEIVMVDEKDQNGGYQKSRIKKVKDLLNEIPSAVWLNQYNNLNSQTAYQYTLANEIISDFKHIDHLVASVSTGAHLSGVSKQLITKFPQLTVTAVDAYGSSIFGFPYKPHYMNGIGLSWTPKNLDLSVIKNIHIVSDVQAFSVCRLLSTLDGLLVGGSGGAVLFSCLKLALQNSEPQIILGIIPDSGITYLNSIYNDEWIDSKSISLFRSLEEVIEECENNSEFYSIEGVLSKNHERILNNIDICEV